MCGGAEGGVGGEGGHGGKESDWGGSSDWWGTAGCGVSGGEEWGEGRGGKCFSGICDCSSGDEGGNGYCDWKWVFFDGGVTCGAQLPIGGRGDVGQWGDVGRVCGGGGEGFFGWGGGGASVCPDWEVGDGAGAESDWDGFATVLHGSGHQCGVRVKFGGDSKVGSRGGGEESVGAGLRGVFLWGQESGSGAGGDS